MQLNPEHITALFEKLNKRINILIVDDYPVIRNALSAMFSTPLINAHIASSAEEARSIIPSVPQWHGWILDIAMEEEESGLELLAEYAQFPFTIMLSGIRSMHTAARAMELGAYKVYDKDPKILEVMYQDACTMAALAYILKGSATKYFSLFEILSRKTVSSAEEWALSACLTTRQLERISSFHFNMTPRFILPFFYSLRFILHNADLLQQTPQARLPDGEESETIAQHIAFVYRNRDRFFNE